MRLLVVAALALVSAPAFGQEALMSKVFACANIAEAGSRHACYDALGPELKQAEGAKLPRTREQKVEVFGSPKATPSPLTAPVTEKPAKPSKDASDDRIVLPVKAINRAGDGYLRFTMENGQVWKQTDQVILYNLGEGPWTAEIKKAALGSYLLSVNKKAVVRVVRVN